MERKSSTNKRQYDLEERLIVFAVSIMEVCELMPVNRTGNHVAGQLLRSGTSAAPNYGEAQSAESRRDFIHKLKVALKELRETRVWLKIIIRREMTRTYDKAKVLLGECEELIKILAKSVKTAESK